MEMQPPPAQRELRLLDVVAVLLRRWRTVLLVAAVTTLVSGAAAVLLKPWYLSATLLVPAASAQAGGQSMVAQFPGLAAYGGGSASASERLIATVLGSRTLHDSVYSRFASRPARAAEVARVLQKGVRTQRSVDGSVIIQVRARDPRLAADVANAFPPLLNNVLARMTAEGARRKQAFLAAQAREAREQLLRSEEQVMAFERDRGATDLQEQRRQSLSAAATLQGEIYRQEAEVARIRRTATGSNPQLRAAEGQLATLREQLRRLTQGGASTVFVAPARGAELKLASARLLREYNEDVKLYDALASALTEAQINVRDNLPVLTVLDPAVPGASTRSIPTSLALGALLGVVLGVVAAFAREGLERLRRNPANAEFLAVWDRFRHEVLPFGRRPAPRVSMGD
ncbi:MAG TPA: Wzz/FepE/Etk N-terminal domain-containing protein [Longimicrobium sp.]|jgi:uncharacterized protein involved in exopolysaccharide biosynthesis